nr:phosphoribosylaminoimidazolesuccinocarboxamide synthase [Desulfobulbaceae bacterium]
MSLEPVTETNFPDLKLIHRGKVRDLYDLGETLLMVATDRISAFDVVMDDPIPSKGEVLTRVSLFWFDYLKDIVPNHLITADVDQYPAECSPYREELRGRSMVVKKAKPLPVECIVRGYISGSFWKAYKKNNVVCGFKLPEGMKESEQFPQVLFTPSTKAEMGLHDENISIEQMEKIVGVEETKKIAQISVALYQKAADYARQNGIIIADTKFELGWFDGELILIDEVLTPDSSRFWPEDEYETGRGQASFDKQFLRDYLLSLDWDKTPPAPKLPAHIVEKTRLRYIDAVKKITKKAL